MIWLWFAWIGLANKCYVLVSLLKQIKIRSKYVVTPKLDGGEKIIKVNTE